MRNCTPSGVNLDGARRVPSLDIIRAILDGSENGMPRKYQNPRLEIRRDVERPYYFVRVTIPVIRENGRTSKRERRNLGFVDEITVKQAKQNRAELLEIVNAGRVLAQSQIKFKDIAKRFLDVRVPQLGFATQNKYRTQIENHILPAFGEMRMCDIDRPAVEQWLTGKAETLGWWSRIDLKGILSGIFTAAADWKLWSGDNPTKGVRIGRKRLVREKRLLSADELRTLTGTLAERPKFIVLIIFGLGLRISEVLGLRWKDIDFNQKTVTIRRRWYRGDLSEEDQTKTEASNATLRLSPPMLAEFQQRYPGPHKRELFIFIGDDGHCPPDDRDILREEFRPVLKRLKLYYPGFGWHAFRRQNITWRQQVGGATPLEAQKAARHASLDMTYLYTLTDADREMAQQQKMFDLLFGLPVEGALQ